MNILSDFQLRVDAAVPGQLASKEVIELQKQLTEKDKKLEKYKTELKKLKSSASSKSSTARSTVRIKATPSKGKTALKSGSKTKPGKKPEQKK